MHSVKAEVSFPHLEEEILKFWKEHDVFMRSMTKFKDDGKTPRPVYSFYDGPPFATGVPHYGHLLAGTIKDVVGRYFTMKGFYVERRFGWDCHGVPVEMIVQKDLGVSGSKDIRQFGIDKFNEECRKVVLRYAKEWRVFVERAGRWVDMVNEYKTMDPEFMESVWWVLKSLWDRGMIYEGLKSVPYSCAMNTPLSNFEGSQNYKQVQDPSITLRAKLLGDVAGKLQLSNLPKDLPINVYIWTSTPWTIPCNLAIAANKELKYSLVLNPQHQEIAVVASELVNNIFPNVTPAARVETQDLASLHAAACVLAEVSGEQLLGMEYVPFFPFFESKRSEKAFRIYHGDFVTSEDGTGLVHCASYGEEDVVLFLREGIPVVDALDESGNFTAAAPDYAGMNFKVADPKIVADLKEKGLLVKHVTFEHSYPYCWRTDTPLIHKPISTWFVRVEQMRDELVENNKEINWVPEHIKEGRFGNWLAGARDWAISRNRFWGTPIPIWRCVCGHTECIGSIKELEEKTGQTVTDLHSHFIDPLTYKCEKCGGVMKRILEVLDCWFESGSMPYAQKHYPFEGKDEFMRGFPADFIAEGVDQTRGWFYTLLVLSTALFKRPAFKNVVVNGILLASDGKKMSKSLNNYTPPEDMMNTHGADAMRLYLLASAATRAEDLRFNDDGVKHMLRQTLIPLWHAYNFLVTYAQVDQWSPDKQQYVPSKNLLDRWILSKLASLVESVDYALSNNKLYAAVPPVLNFVEQLTNWYIRLNRRRFWAGSRPEETADKFDAYATLHKVLLTFVRVLAPLAPFTSEEIFKNLSQGVAGLNPESVHLNPFPVVEELGGINIEPELEEAMEIFEEIILLGRTVRNQHGLKVRQPLAALTVIFPDAEVLERIKMFDGYICDELNVKKVEYTTDEAKYVLLTAQLNTKLLGSVLGPKLGAAKMQALRKEVEGLTSPQIWGIEKGGTIVLQGEELSQKDILIKRTVNQGIKAAASSGRVTISLDTVLTSELRLEGLARDFVNRVQKLRKESGFDVADRIIVKYMTACPHITAALENYKSYVMEEVLAIDMHAVRSEGEIMPLDAANQPPPEPQEIEGKVVIIGLSRTM